MNQWQAFNIEAEENFIGSVFKLGLGSEALAKAFSQLTPEDFYKTKNQKIFSLQKQLFFNGEPIDLLIMADQLGGDALTYIGSIIKTVHSAANISGYVQLIKERSLERVTLAKLNESIAVLTGVGSSKDKINDIASLMATIEQDNSIGQGGVTHVKDIAMAWLDIYEERINNPDAAGIKTGITGLDDLFGNRGVGKTDLIVIGARPKMGKTQLALKMTEHIATTTRKPVMVFSMEMSNEQVFERMLSSSSQVATDNFYQPMGNIEFDAVNCAIAKMAQTDIYIDDRTNMSLSYIRGECRKMKAKKGSIGAIFIDYLTLMKAEKADRNDLAIGAITKGLKNMAKDLKVPVFLLAQLNRGLESRNDKRPIMSDLRETGQIEQDADRIIMIYRESAYDENCGLGGLTELIVRANRHGATGTAYVNMINGIMNNVEPAEVNRIMTMQNEQTKNYQKKKQLDWED